MRAHHGRFGNHPPTGVGQGSQGHPKSQGSAQTGGRYALNKPRRCLWRSGRHTAGRRLGLPHGRGSPSQHSRTVDILISAAPDLASSEKRQWGRRRAWMHCQSWMLTMFPRWPNTARPKRRSTFLFAGAKVALRHDVTPQPPRRVARVSGIRSLLLSCLSLPFYGARTN